MSEPICCKLLGKPNSVYVTITDVDGTNPRWVRMSIHLYETIVRTYTRAKLNDDVPMDLTVEKTDRGYRLVTKR